MILNFLSLMFAHNYAINNNPIAIETREEDLRLLINWPSVKEAAPDYAGIFEIARGIERSYNNWDPKTEFQRIYPEISVDDNQIQFFIHKIKNLALLFTNRHIDRMTRAAQTLSMPADHPLHNLFNDIKNSLFPPNVSDIIS